MGRAVSAGYMQQFARRRDSSCTVRNENGVEWLEVRKPAQLANFVAFCKAHRKRIYLRGQSSSHPHLIPSLFREACDDRHARWVAYKAFLERLSTTVKGTRFTRRNFGAVLQHYGFRTSWLDVVDDLHAALWFALNRSESFGGMRTYRPLDSECGWIVVVSVPRGVRCQDLREAQSSRNTRCHVQQGWSIAMQHDDEAECESLQDFAQHVIGTVRIPNSDLWHLKGFRASQAYFFPGDDMDDTYRQLRSRQVADLAAKIESEKGLPFGVLGRVVVYGALNKVPGV